jgi:hypothetical protein
MTKVLFLNHKKEICGTWQFFKRTYNIVSNDNKYIYREVDSKEEYFQILNEVSPTHIIYNWHWDRMGHWYREEYIINNPLMKHYFVWHDGSIVSNYDKYLFFGDYDPGKNAVPEDKRILLPRPLLDYTGSYIVNKYPTIGSFGFGFKHKQFPELVKLVNKEFNKAIINIHTTYPYFGDPLGDIEKDIYLCRRYNINPNIELNITTDFWDDTTLLNWLAGNDLNVFNYSLFNNPGISAATDYALSVKRPIAITDHIMFRHIRKEEILLEKNSLSSIINKGVDPLNSFYDKWSTENFIKGMDNLFL